MGHALGRLDDAVAVDPVEVDLERQLLLVVDKAKITKVYSVSTGKQGYETPVGTFKVGRKELKSWSVPYKVWLPYASYFTSDGVGTLVFADDLYLALEPFAHSLAVELAVAGDNDPLDLQRGATVFAFAWILPVLSDDSVVEVNFTRTAFDDDLTAAV